MVDVLSKKQRSFCMSRIRGKNTKPEMTIKKLFRKRRVNGWRSSYKVIGKPDFVFPKNKLAIFLDGCFWHACPSCYKEPKTNVEFWRKKILANRKRDLKVNRLLKKKGWKVKRIRECRFRKQPERYILQIQKSLESVKNG